MAKNRVDQKQGRYRRKNGQKQAEMVRQRWLGKDSRAGMVKQRW